MTDITRTEWDLVLRLTTIAEEGQEPTVTEYHCMSHTQTFALNRIPLASCTVPVGRNVRTLEPAKIHSTYDSLKLMFPAEVVLRPKGHWDTSKHADGDRSFEEGFWTTAGEQVIFRGYLTGTGYRKTRGELRLVLHLIHWLSDLAFSSIFSNQSHQENPAQYPFLSVYTSDTSGASTVAKGNLLNQTKYFQEFTESNIKKDLWGAALAEVFCKLSERDLIRVGSPGRCGGFAGDNAQAKAALARMEGDHSCADNPNSWHVPLKLRDLGSIGGTVADAMNRYVGQQSTVSWWATTIWDKLIHDFGPSFLFHVVPRVETALIAPFVPGLRSAYRVSLGASDTMQLDLTSYIRRPLRGVGIFAGRHSLTAASDRKTGDIPTQIGIGGCFMPDPKAKGMILFRRTPSWLMSVPAMASRPSKTIMGRNSGTAAKPTSTATTPVDDADLGGDASGKTAAEVAVEARHLHDDLAQYYYVTEVLRGRGGQLTGKFRMDIAPGSTIFITDIGGQHITAPGDSTAPVDLLAQDMYASVMQVTSGLDAEQQQSGTTFQLAHIRTRAENEDDRTSIASHPLYVDQLYRGSPLVDAYLFDL